MNKNKGKAFIKSLCIVIALLAIAMFSTKELPLQKQNLHQGFLVFEMVLLLLNNILYYIYRYAWMLLVNILLLIITVVVAHSYMFAVVDFNNATTFVFISVTALFCGLWGIKISAK